MLVEKLIKMASQLGTMILLARYLGPIDLGDLMYCYALASIFIFLNNFGLNTIFIKWLTEDKENSFYYIKHAFFLRVVAALFCVLFINLIGLWIVEVESRKLLLLISFYHFFAPVTLIEWYFTAMGRAILSAYGLIAGSVVAFAFRVLVLIQGMDIIWLAVAYSLELIVVMFVYCILLRNFECKVTSPFSLTQLRFMAREALPLILSGAVVMLYMRIDQLMIGYILGNEEVGVYSAAIRLSEAWYFAGLTVLGVYFPRMLQVRKAESELVYLKYLTRMGSFLVYSAVILSIITILLSDWIVVTLYGVEFSGAAQLLRYSICSVVFVYLGGVMAKHYIANGQTGTLVVRAILGLVVNIIANLLLIPTYGSLGAVQGLLLSHIVVGVVFPFLMFKPTEVRLMLRIIICHWR